MGIHDRPYMSDAPGGDGGGGFRGYGGPGGMQFALPRPGKVVRSLLIVNGAVFLLQLFLDREGLMTRSLGMTVAGFWQVWRYITFQFLHGGFWHIVLNMLGLYFLGGPLERSWGARRFLTFYLVCGAVAGLAYVAIGAIFPLSAARPDGIPPHLPLIGASGGVYGVVLACAILFPQFRIIFLFFPVPIRLAALIIFGGMIVLVLQALSDGRFGPAMSDVAHLGGAVAAAVWVWAIPKLTGAGGVVRVTRARINQGAWRRKVERRAEEEAQVDRILQKIKDEGLSSLSRLEKRILQNATRRQREQERRIDKM